MKKNSADLLERVFLEYKSKIDGYIAWKGVQVSDRNDVFSKVLLKATQQAEHFDSVRASVSTWIYIITRSVVIDYFRKRKEEHPLMGWEPSDLDFESRVELETELSELAWQLARLSEKERSVIVLRFYNGMEYCEIAKTMNISEVNARKIHSRALKKLREWMTDEGKNERRHVPQKDGGKNNKTGGGPELVRQGAEPPRAADP